MLAVLTVIAVIAGGALAMVNSVTAPQIEKINAKNLADGIKAVMGSDDVQVAEPVEIEGYTSYKVSDAQGNALGCAVTSSTNGFGGDLKVLVGFDNEGNILGYTILQTSETPGLGAKADSWFQKGQKGDIIGMNPGKGNFTVSKDGGDVDAITASTITSRAFLLAVNNAYDNVIAAQMDGTSSASAQKKHCDKNEECGDCKEGCCGNECDKHEGCGDCKKACKDGGCEKKCDNHEGCGDCKKACKDGGCNKKCDKLEAKCCEGMNK